MYISLSLSLFLSPGLWFSLSLSPGLGDLSKSPGILAHPLSLSLSPSTQTRTGAAGGPPLCTQALLSLFALLYFARGLSLSLLQHSQTGSAQVGPPPSRASSRTGGVTERLTQLVKLRLHHRFSHHNTQNSINHFPPRRISVSPPYDRFWISTARPERRTSRPCPSYRRVAGTHTYPMQTLKRKPQHTAVCMCASLSLLLAC